MKASAYIAEFLNRIGSRRIYTLSGGMVAPLLDAIGEHPSLQIIPVSHEQTASFAAETEGKLDNRPGVAIGTNGPGALNLVTGIASAYCDGVPTLFISGQVQTYLAQLVPQGRQSGLQQIDFAAVCRPIAKEVISITSPAEIPDAFVRAYQVCMGGRKGPVVLDIPLNVQLGETACERVVVPELPAPLPPPKERIDDFARALLEAKRPVVLAGGGAHGSEHLFRGVIRSLGLPIVCTTAGIDMAAGMHELYVGMCGMYGGRAANSVLSESDFVLVLGSRLDHAVLGGDPAGFARKRTIWQADIDPGEAGVRAKPSQVIVADVGKTLEAIGAASVLAKYVLPASWRERVDEIRASMPTNAEQPEMDGINPNHLASQLGLHSRRAAAYVADAGQHTWWLGQSIALESHQRLITSTGLHACGTSIPAAIAASLNLKRPVVVVAGDGGIQLNIQDLVTIIREKLAVKFLIMNNRAHGSVRQFQVDAMDSRFHAAVWGLAHPDFQEVFKGYGIPGKRITRGDEIGAALDWLWEETNQPRMVEAMIDTDLLVRPYVPFGRQLSAMSPCIRPS
jgi:acetolactate synthase-1/2/3 large subunit